MHKKMSSPIISFSYSLLLLLILAPSYAQAQSIQITTNITRLDRLPLPSNALGPNAIAFDSSGVGPYIGVSNGRILKWSGPSIGFVDFAVTSQNWTKERCESVDVNLEPVCGRPLDLGFYNKTGTLYIADAYYNLRSVSSDGGVATELVSSAEGVPFRFINALDVDQDTGIVYFTDASARFQKKDLTLAIVTRDMSGRLMKFDPVTKQVSVLLRGLGIAVGATLSKDGSFILVSEFLNFRILRYWLKGPRANTSEIFFITPEAPNSIIIDVIGDILRAVVDVLNQVTSIL